MANEVSLIRNLFAENIKYGIANETLNQKLILQDIETVHRDLIVLLLSNPLATSLFFEDVAGVKVLSQNKLIRVLFQMHDPMAGSFTAYSNTIGMFVSDDERVALSFPYKDCILVGGMTKEDERQRVEVFYNEILAKDRIDRLFEPKVLCNAVRYSLSAVNTGDLSDSQNINKAAATTIHLGAAAALDVTAENLADNLLVKGNNLIALHSLAVSLRGAVDVCYIDPPYYFKDSRATDTFAYNSNFKLSSWLTFMKNRLEIARELLSPTGVIFVQVGEDGVDYLALLVKDVFQVENNLGIVARVQKKGSDKGKFFKPDLDYLVAFAKHKTILDGFKAGVDTKKFRLVETEGPRAGELYEDSKALYQSSLDSRPNQRYYVKCPDGSLAIPPGNNFPLEEEDGSFIKPADNSDKVWRWSRATYFDSRALLVFKETRDSPLVDQTGKKSKWNVYTKRYLKDAEEKGNVPSNLISEYPNDKGTQELKDLEIDFAYPKPVGLLEHLIKIAGADNAVVLDFFAGSGTTGHAVMALNKKDQGTRKFILVEQMDYADSLTAERLRRAMVKYGYADSFVYVELMRDEFKDTLMACATPGAVFGLVRQHFDRGLFDGVSTHAELLREMELCAANLTESEATQALVRLILEKYFDYNTEYQCVSDFVEHRKVLSSSDVALNASFYGLDGAK